MAKAKVKIEEISETLSESKDSGGASVITAAFIPNVEAMISQFPGIILMDSV